jgi:hypothetical protein
MSEARTCDCCGEPNDELFCPACTAETHGDMERMIELYNANAERKDMSREHATQIMKTIIEYGDARQEHAANDTNESWMRAMLKFSALGVLVGIPPPLGKSILEELGHGPVEANE